MSVRSIAPGYPEQRIAYGQMSGRGWNAKETNAHFIAEENLALIPTALRMLDESGELAPAELTRRLEWAPALFTDVTGVPCVELPNDIIPIDLAKRARWFV